MQFPKITIGRKSQKKSFDQGMAKIKGMASYVGVTAKTSSRKGQKINNAELLFILSKGSPIRKLPATPWLEPSIAADGNREPIANELAAMSKACLDNNPKEAMARLRRAGTAGQNAAQSWPMDARNGWPELKDSTKKSRLRRMKKKARAAFAVAQMEYLAGVGPNPFTRNVDTSALLNSITHVEREE
jgi:hypothetical protein